MNRLLLPVFVCLALVYPMNAAGMEMSQYQDVTGGWFRVSLTMKELKGATPDTLIAVPANTDVYEVFGSSSSVAHRIDATALVARQGNIDDKNKRLQKAHSYLITGRVQTRRDIHIYLNNRISGVTLLDLTIPAAKSETVSTITALGDSIKQEWERMRMAELLIKAAASPGESVYSYVLLQLHSRAETGVLPSVSDTVAPIQNMSSAKRPNLFSLTTGALTVQETLQLERMTTTRTCAATATIPISQLEGPTIISHPFAEMIGAKQSRTLPIDALVPIEFYACHFTDMRRLVAFADLFDLWGANLVQILTNSATQSRVKEKIIDQLCLQVSGLVRLLGGRVIGDIAICGSDPFLSDGTDVTVIIDLKESMFFDLNANRLFRAAKRRVADVRRETITIAGIPVRAETSPDRRVFSFSCDLDRYKVYSNSPRAIKQVIDTFAGRHASLATADDLRYMRIVFPYDPAREGVFYYLSDMHLRNLVSPVFKIGRRRRIECINTLRMIQNAIAMRGMESGGGTIASPPSIANLIASGQLEASQLICPDGGAYYIEGSDGEAVCAVHGRLRFITPILDAPPTSITAAEKADYEEFVKEYNTHWSKFFEPIGIRGVISAGTVEFETCILPLNGNSLYDGFKRLYESETRTMDFPRRSEPIAPIVGKRSVKAMSKPPIRYGFLQFVKQTSRILDGLIDPRLIEVLVNSVDHLFESGVKEADMQPTAPRPNLNVFREIAEHSGPKHQKTMRERCLANLGSLHSLRYFRGVEPTDWDRMSLLVNGVAPFCPAGGHYEDDPTRGGIRCSIHGDGFSPTKPFYPDATLPLNMFLDALKSVEATLSFTPEGIMTKVRLHH
ncbi:MAG: hypothetical protein HQM09_14900 [Candidatus Riflebacteria bacterium]|nr:hypothetical protein [Candidatus Riflebacteria bacterium]